jgi:hypothetical protein
VNTVTGRTVATAKLLLCPFAFVLRCFLKKIGAITAPTEGYLSVGTQRGQQGAQYFPAGEKEMEDYP